MVPDIPKIFRTIELYRHSITVGLLVFCGIALYAIYAFSLSIGWEAVYSIPVHVTIIVFFLSFGMIVVRDIWPFFRSLLGWDLSEDEKKRAATEILGASQIQSKKVGENFPLEVEVESEAKKDFIRYNFEKNESRVEGNRVIVTEDGHEALKEYI